MIKFNLFGIVEMKLSVFGKNSLIWIERIKELGYWESCYLIIIIEWYLGILIEVGEREEGRIFFKIVVLLCYWEFYCVYFILDNIKYNIYVLIIF